MIFDALVPEMKCRVEVARVCTPLEHIKAMIDMLAKSTNYYPTKPEADGKKV